MFSRIRELCKSTLCKSTKKFLTQQKGGIAIMTGLTILSLVILFGLAIDTARVAYVETKLAHAVSAAAIAGAKYKTEDAAANVQKVFDANFPPGIQGTARVNPTMTITENGDRVRISAQTTMPTAFGKIIGIDTLPVRSVAEGLRELGGLEIAMVFDVSGLTGFREIIPNMQTAAKNFVDIIYQSDKVTNGRAVSITPYGGVVNVGNSHTSWVHNVVSPDAPFIVSSFPTGEPWQGCVANRKDPLEESEAPPTVERWPVHYARSTVYPAIDGGTWPPMHNGKWDNDWSVDSNGDVIQETTIRDGPGANGYVTIGPNRSCPPAILPLTADPVAIKNYIDNQIFTVYGSGTFSNLGMGWGWRTISPNFDGLWTGGAPIKAYDAPNNLKVLIILLNDGNRWLDGPFPQQGDPTAYGRLEDGKLGTTNLNFTKYEIEVRTEELCNKIKAQGVFIYTVSLMVDDLATRELYGRCASDPTAYHNINGADELEGAYENIAEDILLRVRRTI
ncbi:MAG: pilus assembly protein TadG-related protein [Pseudomonadota bacterium]